MKKCMITNLLIACLVMTSACAGTKFIHSWKDPTYGGRMSKVFVLGVVRVRGPRSLLEEEFVRQLKARGVEAVASTSVLADEALPARDAVAAKVRESGADTVLVAKFIRKESTDTHVPNRTYDVPVTYYEDWTALSGAADASEDSVGDVSYPYQVAVMQTTVYDAATQKPVWSAGSETRHQGALMHQIKPFVSAVMDRLYKEKLVK